MMLLMNHNLDHDDHMMLEIMMLILNQHVRDFILLQLMDHLVKDI